jgi:potassium-dependent mechanosensitive channel
MKNVWTGALRRVLGSYWVACCVIVPALPAPAQPVPPSSGGPASPAALAASARLPLTPGDILLLASQDQRFVDRVRRHLAQPDPTSDLFRTLASLEAPVEEKLRTFSADALATLPIERLESLDRHWQFDARRFSQWQAQAQRKLRPLDDAAAQVAQRRAVWDATLASAVLDQLPPPMISRVHALVSALDQVRADMTVPLARQIELTQRANALAGQIETGSAEVEDAIASIDRRLLALDAPPLWALPHSPEPDAEAPGFSRGLEIEAQFARAYAAAAPANRTALLFLQLLLLGLIVMAWQRVKLADRGREGERAVLRRPVSAWVLLSMMAVLVLEPDAPLLALQIAIVVMLLPLARLLPAQRPIWLRRWPLAAVGLYVLDGFGLLPSGLGTTYRLFHLALALLALALTLWMIFCWRRSTAMPSRLARFAAWATAGLLGSAALLNVVGNTSLADVLFSGVINSTVFGLLLYAAVIVTRALAGALLDDARLGRLPVIGQHGAEISSLLSRVLVWCATAGWAVYAMTAFRIMRPVQAAAADVLGHRFEVGEISVSPGDVLVFAVSILIAWWVARGVRQLLGEQLSARQSLPRGVASSVASLSYYGLMLLGFLVALSAAGFKVGQLAFVFGALGVGIGFGLQNIVNNFVSGLVLMFERPLRPGDVVDVAGVSGRVRAIGMRATSIRTFDGADVVVPNGSILSSSLVNWTLVDHHRRIEIDVGVVYGCDPARVVALLEAVARETPGIAAEPAPSAVMKGYGDSSLDFALRAWTTDFDSWVGIRSNLLMRVLDALNANGIEIPFTQVDLNLRAVSDPAAAVLRQGPQPSAPRQPSSAPGTAAP